MTGFEFFIYLVISLALSVALSFINKPPRPPNAQPGEVEVPTTNEGLPIRVVFGRVLVKPVYIAWYGDTRVTPIMAPGGKK